MPFRYATSEDVFRELELDENDASNASPVEQIERIENALADAFDHRVGRSFGETPVASTRTIAVGHGHCMAILSSPAREIVGVAHGGKYDGTTWEGETVEDGWIQRLDAKGHIYGIERNGGEWPATIRVTAIWSSDTAAGVPEDVRYALTYLTVKEYRQLTSSPTDQVGPEGLMIPTPSHWNNETMRILIDKYRVVEVIV